MRAERCVCARPGACTSTVWLHVIRGNRYQLATCAAEAGAVFFFLSGRPMPMACCDKWGPGWMGAVATR